MEGNRQGYVFNVTYEDIYNSAIGIDYVGNGNDLGSYDKKERGVLYPLEDEYKE